MITQKCNLIALAIFYDNNFNEEVAFLYSPISHYYLIMPTKHFLTTEEKNGTLFITELKNAYFIPSSDIGEKLREWRNRD